MAGIYLHVPFCKTRCIYCDFYSTTEDGAWKDRYVDALCRELELQRSYLGKEPIKTVYFGGGTPSQLGKEDFEKIFQSIRRHYILADSQEITLEANPDDLSSEYIALLRQFPFNRISIGIQTFQDNLLQMLCRRHSAEQAIRAVKDCRAAGFENISIDLMYGLPGETLSDWDKDLQQALELKVEHISAYHLIYEEETPLWKMREKHIIKEIEEENSISLFARLIEKLTKAGYQHYEISNFCLPDKHSRHNTAYWTGKKYLGCGPSAHSFNGENRQWNIASLPAYLQGIEENTPIIQKEESDLCTRYNDFIITSLRTMWGLSLDRLFREYGRELYDYCLKNAQKYIKSGKLLRQDDTLLISKEGIFISDGIMSDLLWV